MQERVLKLVWERQPPALEFILEGHLLHCWVDDQVQSREQTLKLLLDICCFNNWLRVYQPLFRCLLQRNDYITSVLSILLLQKPSVQLSSSPLLGLQQHAKFKIL